MAVVHPLKNSADGSTHAEISAANGDTLDPALFQSVGGLLSSPVSSSANVGSTTLCVHQLAVSGLGTKLSVTGAGVRLVVL